MEALNTALEFLQSGGPWAIVVFLAWAYLHKDAELKQLYKQVIELSTQQAKAITELRDAVDYLKEALRSILVRM